ncbi:MULTISPECIES: hypothetical protein [unclassified Mesorhizobium]|uniref:hypothetical protein n=1 Tax=unclassified Mesorhizobium TaxID=325217 RepID=UPI001125CC7E|nr:MULTISPECIES: hypothetical protein [unclassified Mesorhizobium]TPL03744.1 hypothetical protein FJ567_05500 [Mesorhizobium sp. B2-4-16]TPL03757.1 hypothetical protein FJ567_05605 [Mesorhizobium sp. B2-4-16]TPL62325.1 hypothetical protein FJ956_25245 [Mesorhizobium sp. B2-4-3]
MKASKKPNWVFEPNPRMGGAVGEAYTNTLASSGMHPEAVVAREAIQNSVDARAEENQKVSVDFVTKALTGAHKAAFAKAAGLPSIQERADRLGFRDPNCITTISDKQTPLRLLYINDHGTTGLKGDPSSSDSNFYKFLLTLGDGGKEQDEHGTGGSYGYGKSVYSANSGIQTIFAYSRTKNENGEPLSLLFGCGYYRKHAHLQKVFTGRGWFGLDNSPSVTDAQPVVDPLLNDAADAMASLLGFDNRSADDLGTSVLIVDTLLSSDGILEGVEDWWWPRLISHKLDVRVVREDGKEELPRPRKRHHLRPFLEAYDIATGKSPSDGKTQFQKPIGKNDGYLGLSVLKQEEDGDYAVAEDRTDSVALIRSPLMVVAYYRKWNVGTPVLAGAFLASADIDLVLRSSEPPAHDRWDPEARRLQDQTGSKRMIVERVLSGIRKTVKSSQKTASPPTPSKPKRLTFLERTLASLLSPSKSGTAKKPEVAAAPIHLEYDKVPHTSADGEALKLAATFSVRLKADEASSAVKVRLKVTCPIIEDGATGDSLKLSIKTDSALEVDPDNPEWMTFVLSPDKPSRFSCETEKYDPLWTVRFVPEVEAVGA